MSASALMGLRRTQASICSKRARTAALLQKFSGITPRSSLPRKHLPWRTEHGGKAFRFGTGNLPSVHLQILCCKLPIQHAIHRSIMPAQIFIHPACGQWSKRQICDGKILMLEREIPGEREITYSGSTISLCPYRSSSKRLKRDNTGCRKHLGRNRQCYYPLSFF